MKSQVLNTNIGRGSLWSYPKLTASQEEEMTAQLFEQLMLFDKVVISTNRLNFGLYFLIKKLGLKTVEQLLDKGCISFMLWTPLLVSGSGKQMEDGSIDESVIYTQPPIAACTFSDEESDPENNINRVLSNLSLARDVRRDLTKKLIKHYQVPNGIMVSTESANLIINSYKKGLLDQFGLPFQKEPNLLTLEERQKMLGIGIDLLETAILSDFNLKSYRNFEHFNIIKQSIERIGKAYKIAENADSVLNYEYVPDLKELFLQEKLDFESVFKLRQTGNAKYFRNWINGVGEKMSSKEITIEYLNEIKGKNKSSEAEHKLMHTIASIIAGAALGAIPGPEGLMASAGLTIFEKYILENILKGKNPSMFVEDIKTRIN